MKEFIVKENEQQRLIKLLGKILSNANNGFLYKMLRKKNIVLNDKKATGNESLKTGDSIKIYFSDETFEKLSGNRKTDEALISINNKTKKDNAFVLDNNIIYENKDVILINKPAGILSQKADKSDTSVVEYLTEYMLSKEQITRNELVTFKPAICNRLDRNTSGIILAGKSLLGLRLLNDIVAKRQIDKYYLTVVKGELTRKIESDAFLYKDEKNNKVRVFNSLAEAKKVVDNEKKLQNIKTIINPLDRTLEFTLLEIKLITGKTHQIRATMEHLGFPVYGDEKYGKASKVNESGKGSYTDKFGKNHSSYQMLHAYKVVFLKEMKELGMNKSTYIAKPSKEFTDTLIKLGFKEERLWDIIKEEA